MRGGGNHQASDALSRRRAANSAGLLFARWPDRRQLATLLAVSSARSGLGAVPRRAGRMNPPVCLELG